MRIAQVSPLWERVPPQGYGGIELMVGYLSDELVRRGHEVTLFASGDSKSLATLESVVSQPLRVNPEVVKSPVDPRAYEELQNKRVQDLAQEFDLIHIHSLLPPFHLAEAISTPAVYTMHWRFTPATRLLYEAYSAHNFISISLAQRQDGPNLNYVGNVYNGIDSEGYPLQTKAQEPPYLAFVGRMAPTKGPHLAIEVAKKVGLPLKMAGKVDKPIHEFFVQEIEPQIDGNQIQYLGEVGNDEKQALLGGALATLFPITWEEPFGLVMIESMAAGTPVIALRRGSVPEVVADHKTGFVCESVDDMVAAVHQLDKIERSLCRDWVIDNFSISSMVDGYEVAYQKVLLNQNSLTQKKLQLDC